MIRNLRNYISSLCCLLFFFSVASAQSDTSVYHLTIDEGIVTVNGVETKGMTVNGGVPGPTVRFKEGGYAVLYVENNMKVETSVHWHGMILPNFMDGVPYLSTPPILPGTTFKYEFPLEQAGTYWYHSHTLLQEQSGVYGSIVIEKKDEELDYDRDLVLVLSDWTYQKPMNVMRNLKRGNEWYNIKKGTATPLNRVIVRGGLAAQVNFWRQRMESADIADVYYNAFLVNGSPVADYPDLMPGERVRLRIINASASSQFWMTFGGETPFLVAADGPEVVPVRLDSVFIAIAETYDFILTLPETGKVELRAMAQDGSGHANAYFGRGDTLKAKVLAPPDKIGMMMRMAKMKMRMGAPAMRFNPSDVDPHEQMENWGMKGEHRLNMDTKMEMPMDGKGMGTMDGDSSIKQKKMHKGLGKMNHKAMEMDKGKMAKMDMFAGYNYNYLQAKENTEFSEDRPVKDVLLNLTGNMWRYIWSLNGVPLNEADKIKVERGEVLRITLNNLTMMHHPMHLHGHFFRVINEHGEYSPLKHTVNLPPMQKVKIEFSATEPGDWFFHCHVLYHLVGGMARVFSYDTPRDPRLEGFPVKKMLNEGNRFYNWGMADVASHMTEVNLVSSNIRNQFTGTLELGWNENMEAELTYERYLYDYFRVFGGINIENENEKSLEKLSTTAIAGFRFFTPYMFNLDVRMDNELRPQIGLSRSVMIFPKTVLFGEYEYQADFGWVNDLTTESGQPVEYKAEKTWSAGLEYFLSRNFSLMGSYDNRFGAGGGLSVRF